MKTDPVPKDKKYRIRRKNRDLIEPEEIFLDAGGLLGINGGGEREVLDDLEKTKIETPIRPRVILSIFVLIGAALTVLLAGSFYLEVVQGKFYSAKADKNMTRAFSLTPLRGVIYDRNHQQLVFNIASFDVVAFPKELPKDDAILRDKAQKLASILNVGGDELYSSLAGIRATGALTSSVVKSGIDLNSAIAIEGDPAALQGVEVEKNFVRIYPFGSAFSHVLGYLGKVTKAIVDNKDYFPTDYIGKSGLELSYEDVLRGQPGKVKFEVDARQNVKREIVQDAKPGDNIVLSIDKDLALASEGALKRELGILGLSKGAVVIENPKTGEILSLVSLPDFDLNQFSKGLTQDEYDRVFNNSAKPMFNRAVSGMYPIGSTIKPVIASAALQEKVIDASWKIFAPGQIVVPNPYFPDKPSVYRDWKTQGFGWIDLKGAIAWSCNVCFYTIGGGWADAHVQGLGIDRIKKYAGLFGLGSKSGVDLPGEAAGFFPDPAWKKKANKQDPLWRIGDTYHVSIGQGEVLATPLQVADYVSAIANGGKLMKPYLVTQVTDQDGSVVEEKKPEVLRSDFVSADNLKIVREGMRQTVTAGSAQSLSDLPFEVAGKTGTAQYDNNTRSHAWFAGFAPYNDPQVAITVLIEGGGEGSQVAVPVAKEILDWYYWNRIFTNQ